MSVHPPALSRPATGCFATIVACLLIAGVPSVASAAPPPNDDFAHAQDVQLPGTIAGTIDDATLEPGEPEPDVSTASVWYRYTAASAGRVRLETCGSTFHARATVYTGAAVDALT